MTPKEVLVKARKIIADPKRFTKGVYARDASGVECSAQDGAARQFCSIGATYRVELSEAASQAKWMLNDKALLLFKRCVVDVNDGPDGRRKMLKVFDAAIAACDIQ
jgi:hypothetical protein